MATQTTTDRLRLRYERAAQRYLLALPLEHFMESTPQATQRKITLESLDLVAAQRDDFHVYNELLVQYPLADRRRPGQVVPDNMVVIYNGSLDPEGSYDVPLQPAKPFWVLEYVSKNNSRKDYVDNMRHYEEALQVPYYLLFRPDTVEMTLYRHEAGHYVAVEPNRDGRCAIPELEIEVGVQDGWVRFWYRGELLPLPGEMLRSLEDAEERTDKAIRRAEIEQERAKAHSQRADAADKRAEAERQRAEGERQRAEAERQARLAVENELAALRAKLARNE